MLTILAVFSLGSLVAQNNPPATNPPTGSRSTSPQSTTQQNTQIPGVVSKRFSTDYPNMNSTWSTSGTNYRAEYMDSNSKMGRAILYDKSGNPIGMEQELGKGEYPASINDYYTVSYPNEQYRVWTSNGTDGKRNYFVTRKSEVIWFDDKGTYTRKVPRSSDIQ